jgi:membrane protein DedA with SNARE-associated domain
MQRWVDALLERLLQVPPALLHLVLGLAAALENLIPPLPADIVILFGGFLIGHGATRFWVAFLVVWSANLGGALLVYALGRAYGPAFFERGAGRLLLRPRQLASLARVYRRCGFGVILASRFLPMFRSLVPVFAGVSRLGFARTALPIGLASALWYGALLYVGAMAGQNWAELVTALERIGRWLYLAAAVVAALVAYWWWHSRHDPRGP